MAAFSLQNNPCNDQKFHEEIFDKMKQALRQRKHGLKGLNSLHGDELQKVIQALPEFNAIRNRIVPIDSRTLLDPGHEGSFALIPPSEKSFNEVLDDFKTQEGARPLYFLINTASEPGYKSYGHWIPVKCERREHDVHFTTGDSMGWNWTGYFDIFERLYELCRPNNFDGAGPSGAGSLVVEQPKNDPSGAAASGAL